MMTTATIAALSFSMSADAFAAALAKGAALDRTRLGEALRTGAIFGIVEAITPLIGWALGYTASSYIAAVDHWIAFGLLGVIGARMILGAIRHDPQTCERPKRHGLLVLVGTAIGTSLDAMAVGVSLALLDGNITIVAAAIGLATFAMVTVGMLLGRLLGARLGRWAEGLGGVTLMAIGTDILMTHMMAA